MVQFMRPGIWRVYYIYPPPHSNFLHRVVGVEIKVPAILLNGVVWLSGALGGGTHGPFRETGGLAFTIYHTFLERVSFPSFQVPPVRPRSTANLRQGCPSVVNRFVEDASYRNKCATVSHPSRTA